jgi:putative ABC transport system permease protein
LFPFLVVTIGVMMTVILQAWIAGIVGDMIDYNARFSTGHVKIMTRAYADNADQIPNDLALVGVTDLITRIREDFPELRWVQRIHFGGILDVPDEEGESRTQGPATGLAVDLLSDNTLEINTLNIAKAVVTGHLPEQRGEILIGDEFATRLGVKPGDSVTLISSTMYGGLTMENFVIAGTVRFGVGLMDRGTIVVDIRDAQQALDMEDAAGEILGFFRNWIYDDVKAQEIVRRFQARYSNPDDEFAPVMVRLSEQNGLGELLEYVSAVSGYLVVVFVLFMSIVLWNTGLIGGLRRYGEVGLRLAIGEPKSHIYRTMIYESILIGLCGSLVGTAIGLGFAYLLQTRGFDVSSMMKNITMMVPTVYRAQITPTTYYIGFLPGLFSTVLGTALSGIGIYRRQTAQLFRELEV